MKRVKNLVRAYLDDIKDYKLLDKDEELRLLKAAHNGSEDAKNQLILSNLRLVVNIAKGHLNRGLSFIDLISEGNLGLIKAIDKFDSTKGFRFSTYAVWWIKQAINKAIINKGREIRIPSYKYDLLNKINNYISEVVKKGGNYPNVKEIAEGLNLTDEKVESVMVEFQDLVSLNASIGSDIYLEDIIMDDPHNSTENKIIDSLVNRDILNSLDDLKERERQILIMRYGLNESETKTLEEIGSEFNITRERVRQIEKRALEKLREKFRKDFKEYIDY